MVMTSSVFSIKPERSSEEVASEYHATISRRDAVGAAALAASTVLLNTPLVPVAEADECKLETAPNGLQYCDLVVGTGPSPVQGALIRYYTQPPHNHRPTGK